MYSNSVAARRGVDSRLAQVFLSDVRAGATALLPIFRSRLQGEVLARLLLGPERELGILELARLVRGDLATVAREVTRLSRAGLLTTRQVAYGPASGRSGRGRLVSRNPASPLFEPLARLVLLTFGPAVVIEEEFGPLPGLRRAALFGDWAARYSGEEGEPPRDLDVLLIGDLDPAALRTAADQAESRLGLPVNPVVRTLAQWLATSDPFLRTIKATPLVHLIPPPRA